jgi:hypothetical protein
MKKSILSFADGFMGIEAKIAREQGKTHKAFDWDKAAEIIKEKIKLHPDLKAEAGLWGDWDWTGGAIFRNGKPTNCHYTYLCSNWAKPTLILEWDGKEQEVIECFTEANERFHSGTKWDEISLAILGINFNFLKEFKMKKTELAIISKDFIKIGLEIIRYSDIKCFTPVGKNAYAVKFFSEMIDLPIKVTEKELVDFLTNYHFEFNVEYK